MKRKHFIGLDTHCAFIEVVAVIPIFFLQGLSGAFFRPLVFSYAIALLVSMAVALTVTPALALIFLSPFAAGAMVAAARSDEPPRLSRLLAGAGEFYGRMLRTLLTGLVPPLGSWRDRAHPDM